MIFKREEDISIYAAGPMDGVSWDQMTQWRFDLMAAWKGPILDPCRRFSKNTIKQIVELDKVDIRNTDVTLANCWKPSFGTAMEIPYSFGLGKLVVVVWPKPDETQWKDDWLSSVSPWVRYHSHFVTHNMDDALEFIRVYYGC